MNPEIAAANEALMVEKGPPTEPQGVAEAPPAIRGGENLLPIMPDAIPVPLAVHGESESVPVPLASPGDTNTVPLEVLHVSNPLQRMLEESGDFPEPRAIV